MFNRKLAFSYYLNLETTSTLVTPDCVATHTATLSDSITDYELAWRKATNSLLVDTFFELLKKANIDFFVEIGAFDGVISRKVENFGIKNCVAFEANPFTYAKFKTEFFESGVNYINLGVSDEKGTSKIKIPKHSNEMELPNSSFLVRSEGSNYTDVEIQTISINSILDFLAKPINRGAAWVDVEGFTYNLIKADVDFLKSINLLFLEVEDFPYWKGQKLVVEIIEVLLEKNFVPLLRDYEGRGQYNIIFIKADSEVANNAIVSDYLIKINRIPHNCQKASQNSNNVKSLLKKYFRSN